MPFSLIRCLQMSNLLLLIIVHFNICLPCTLACTMNNCYNLRKQANTVGPDLVETVVPVTISPGVTKATLMTTITRTIKKKRCCPYDFDSRMCRVVGDRVLCGYNKNIERTTQKDGAVYFNRFCRIRNGRMECGYWDGLWKTGGLTNPRRPPPFDKPRETPTSDDDDDDEAPIDINKIDNTRKPTKRIARSFTKIPLNNSVTKCIEIDGRIVCRPM